MRIIMLSCCFFSFFGWSCGSKKYLASALPERQITFGHGGGVSGQIVEYALLENGQLFCSNSLLNETTSLKSTKKKLARQYFEQCDTLQLQNVSFNEPANRYYFIGVPMDGEKHQIVWHSESKPDEAIVAFYRTLMDLVKDK